MVEMETLGLWCGASPGGCSGFQEDLLLVSGELSQED